MRVCVQKTKDGIPNKWKAYSAADQTEIRELRIVNHFFEVEEMVNICYGAWTRWGAVHMVKRWHRQERAPKVRKTKTVVVYVDLP